MFSAVDNTIYIYINLSRATKSYKLVFNSNI